MNILIPIAGSSAFFENPEYQFPKPLVEIDSVPMIELAVKNLNTIRKKDLKFIFVVRKQDCNNFHLDYTLKLLTQGKCEIISIDKETKGAACTCLLAVEFINNEEELIICNGDQIINHDLNKALGHFEKANADSGLICFDSVHPKWSYARLDETGKVIETAEKRPISQNSIAGFYYFQKGKDFVRAAFQSILNDANINGLYYIAPCINELVLEGKNIEMYKIKNSEYHSFYSPQKIKEYQSLSKKS